LINARIAEIIRKSLYVNNCVISVNTEEEYEDFKEKSVKMFAEAKMKLRQWKSNLKPGESPVTSVLGLKWDKARDELYCKVPKVPAEFQTTK